jgi:hypothetical protein
MQILRSVVAIVGGFWFIAATVWAGTLVAARVLVPGYGGTMPPALPVAYQAALLAVSGLGSLMGGWLAARIAPFAPFTHAAVLAAIDAAMSVNLLIKPPDGPPLRAYAVANAVIGVLGVLLGGKLRAAAAADCRGVTTGVSE